MLELVHLPQVAIWEPQNVIHTNDPTSPVSTTLDMIGASLLVVVGVIGTDMVVPAVEAEVEVVVTMIDIDMTDTMIGIVTDMMIDTEAAAEVEEAEAEGAMIDMMTDTGPEGPHQGIVEEVEVEEEDTMTDAGLPGTMMVEARLLLDMMIGATMIGGTRRGGEVLAIFRVRCTSVV